MGPKAEVAAAARNHGIHSGGTPGALHPGSRCRTVGPLGDPRHLGGRPGFSAVPSGDDGGPAPPFVYAGCFLFQEDRQGLRAGEHQRRLPPVVGHGGSGPGQSRTQTCRLFRRCRFLLGSQSGRPAQAPHQGLHRDRTPAARSEAATHAKNGKAGSLVIAWRIMLMTLLGRESPDLPAEILFSDFEIRVLKALALQRRLAAPTKLENAVHLVARLGGYLARKNDLRPDTKSCGEAFPSYRS